MIHFIIPIHFAFVQASMIPPSIVVLIFEFYRQTAELKITKIIRILSLSLENC